MQKLPMREPQWEGGKNTRDSMGVGEELSWCLEALLAVPDAM